MPLFSGACTALVTPFLGGKINYPLLRRLIRRQIRNGIQAIVLAGTTGEAPTLSDKEKIELFSKGVEFAQGDAMILAGTGCNDTIHALELSQEAQEAGVQGLLIVSPYYNKANNEGLVKHYMRIAHKVSLPIILYNVPGRTGLDMPVSVYQRLSRIENIVGVKEASSDITKITKIRLSCPDSFAIWSGNDDQGLAAMALGASGLISVASNVVPGAVQRMCLCGLSGDFQTALAIHNKLHPLTKELFADVNPIPVKAAMECIGYDCGECRLPLGPPEENLKIGLRRILQRLEPNDK